MIQVDKMYMSFVVGMNGSGGWPLTVFLSPDLKPFYGGTYFAPVSKYGRPSFPKIVEYFGERWNTEGDKLQASSDKILEEMRRSEQVCTLFKILQSHC
jgi:uncharacterized protein